MTEIADIKKALLSSQHAMARCECPNDIAVGINEFEKTLIQQGVDHTTAEKVAKFADSMDIVHPGDLAPWKYGDPRNLSRDEEKKIFAQRMDDVAKILYDRYFSSPKSNTALIKASFGEAEYPVRDSNGIKFYDFQQDLIGSATVISGKNTNMDPYIIAPNHFSSYELILKSEEKFSKSALSIFKTAILDMAGINSPTDKPYPEKMNWYESSKTENIFFLDFKGMTGSDAARLVKFLQNKYGTEAIEDTGPQKYKDNDVYEHSFKIDMTAARKMVVDINKQLDLLGKKSPETIRFLQDASGVAADFK